MFSIGLGDSNDKFINDTFSNVFQTFVTDTLARNNLISTGKNPGGNLSQAQIAQGQRPVEQTVIPSPNGQMVMNSMSGGMLGMSSTMTWVVIGGVVLLAGIYFLRK